MPNTVTCHLPWRHDAKPCALRTLRKRHQFLAVAAGFSAPRKTVVIQANANQEQSNVLFGLTASRRVGNAVLRNRAKRRLRHAAHACLPELSVPGGAYVFIARTTTASCAFDDLIRDIRSALTYLRRQLTRSRQTTSAPRQR